MTAELVTTELRPWSLTQAELDWLSWFSMTIEVHP